MLEEACTAVFEALGPGLSESTYQRALAVELRARAQHVSSEIIIPVTYKAEQVGFIRFRYPTPSGSASLTLPSLQGRPSHK